MVNKTLAWIRILLWLVIDLLLLMPLKILATVVIKLAWKPDVDYIRDHSTVYSPRELDVRVKPIEIEYSHILNDGDGVKWLGLLVGSGGGLFDKAWLHLMHYIDDNGIIGRHPVGHPERDNTVAFSGDMFAGLSLAVARYLRINMVGVHDKEKLIKLWEQVLWKGKPFQFADVRGSKRGADRGNLWPWFSLGPEVLQVLVFLFIGYRLTKQKRYLVLYHIIRFLYYPLLAIGLGDYGIFVRNVYAVAWFVPHSKMCVCSAGYLLTKDPLFKKAARTIAERYNDFNADISAMYWDVFETRLMPIMERQYLSWMILDAYGKGRLAYEPDMFPVKKKRYFSLRSFEFKEMSDRWLSPGYRGQKYVWENNPLETTTGSDDRRKNWIYDLLVAYHFLRNSEGNENE